MQTCCNKIVKMLISAFFNFSSLTVNTVYSLVAVIDHRGGVENGHYVTFRKTPENWHVVSDEMTRTVPLSHVLNSNAYMLFYERTKST